MTIYGLIGFPLGHSFSKKYFTEKFEKEGLRDCCFELFPMESVQELNPLLAFDTNIKGLAVTIPHKQAVIPLLKEVDDAVLQIGAVNCIKILPEGLKGFNTDVIGFEQSFVQHLQPHHAKALVFGTGGASKAVQYVLRKLGIEFLLVSRKKSTSTIRYDEVSAELLAQYQILLNTTPLGMTPDEDTCVDIPYEYISPNHYCYDLVYKPAETLFLKNCRQHGALVKNGFDMLIIQAEKNWEIWNA